ncbi:hypothetical protein LQZ18_19030 [Lachnospiraceae bacterium ZAX-1]
MGKHIKIYLLALAIACMKIISISSMSVEFEITLYEINMLGLGNPYFIPGYMMLLITDLFPVFIIQFLEGIAIYRHFCTGSVYYFSRQESRRKWFLEECGKMAARIGIYFSIYLITSVMIPFLWFRPKASLEVFAALFYILAYYILYTIFIAIWINIFSILFGSQMGLSIVYGIQLVFVAILLLFEHTVSLQGIGVWLLKLNPLANIILAWHSSNHILKGWIGAYPIEFDLNISILYLGLLVAVSLLAGAFIVEGQDISLQNREVSG